MNAQEFAYWLQGFVELHGEMPTPEQWQSIKEHLAMVFVKVTQPVKKETVYPNDLTKVPRLSDFQWPGGVQPVITCGPISSLGDAFKSASITDRAIC